MQKFRRLIMSGPRLERDAASKPADLLVGSELVLSRKLCGFRARSIKGQKIDRKLLASLVIEAQSVSGLADPGLFVSIGQGWAQVWTWDQHTIASALSVPARQMVPESAFHAPSDGFILRACLDGVEGQLWIAHEMVASQWWPRVPEHQEWALFKRSCGSSDHTTPDKYPDVYVGYAPGAKRRPNRAPGIFVLKQISWAEWAGLAASVAVIPAAFLAIQNLVIVSETSRLSRQQAGLQEATSELRSLGRQISRLEDENQMYRDAMSSSNALGSIAPVFEEIARQGGQVDQFTLDNDTIEATVSAASELSEREIVLALESSDFLDQVSVQRQGGAFRWTVRARQQQDGS